MHILISDVSYFDRIKERLPAEFAKGNRLLLFFNNDQPLPNEVFEYISRGKVRIKKLPGPLEECLLLVMYELGKMRATAPDDRYTLWGDEILTGLMKFFVQYDEEEAIRFSIDKFKSTTETKGKKVLPKETPKKPQEKKRNEANQKQALQKTAVKETSAQIQTTLNSSDTAALLTDLENTIPDSMRSVPVSKNVSNKVHAQKNIKNHSVKKTDNGDSQKKELKIENKSYQKETVKADEKEKSYHTFEETFQSFLCKLTGNSFSTSDTAYVIESLLISSGSSQAKISLELFQKQLCKFFPAKRAEEIYKYLSPYYENIVSFIQ